MPIGFTVNSTQGTRSFHKQRVTINMDVVCQEIIAEINQAEVQKLAALEGVQYASFGNAVIDPPNGRIVADGWLENIDIVGFSQKTKTTNWHDPVHRWDADITVAYTGQFVLAEEGVGEPSRPAQQINALNQLREKFRVTYGV